MFVGVDPGQKNGHVVALDDRLRLVDAWVLDASELGELERRLRGARAIAIDAPEALSTAPHRGDDGLSPKFRTARCAEIALGREHRLWVPWVTPTRGEDVPGWMQVGFALFGLARHTGARVIEVFPHAGYRLLAGETVPSKQTAGGRRRRAELLRNRGVEIDGLAMRSHDSLDACLAALIAYETDAGIGQAVSCGHDGSAIWLPQPARGA